MAGCCQQQATWCSRELRSEELIAYNATTGEKLWSAPTQTGVLAPPVTYSIDGEQYVAVVVGWGAVSANFLGVVTNAEGMNRNISRILAFKAGGTAELPPAPARLAPAPAPQDFGTDAQVRAGEPLFMRFCAICHGAFAISGGVIPDVRHSALIAGSASFESVVLGGALQENGMASFAEALNEQEVEAIRAYIVRQANQ